MTKQDRQRQSLIIAAYLMCQPSKVNPYARLAAGRAMLKLAMGKNLLTQGSLKESFKHREKQVT